MATVVVEVTLTHLDDRMNEVPAQVLAAVEALPHVQQHGWSKRGSSPWRAQFLVRGPDCVATAKSLEQRLRDLGYEAYATFSP